MKHNWTVDALSREETLRYSRHLIMPEVGLKGQLKLRDAKVLLIGAGGLGSPAALYLAAAGIGTIGIVDYDVVDFSNLQRQVIHGMSDVGHSKLNSAETSILEVNPGTRVVKHETLLSSENALEVLKGYDVVVDGTDNFPTRYLVNDACVLLGVPYVYGSIFRFEGQATVFGAKDGPCYRCLYPEPPPPGMVPSCAEGGVLGVLPGVIGLIQSTEAVKLLLSIGEPLIGRLLLYDALAMRFQEVAIKRDPTCPLCGDAPTITGLVDYYQFCGVPGHGVSHLPFEDEIEPIELRRELGDQCVVLVDVREPHEYEINHIEGSLLVPLRELPARIGELDAEAETVVYCLVGARSADACELLRSAGFKRVRNLKGGIRAWISQVEPDMVNY
ncbi:MAG: molybdopterin-synthase adenylyltransferase MoeB [Armatimonadetes bacterium]|nr:molybdopterin-synthase adenylyltransferase MoeB [Armatimonadota bacterium]